MIRLDKRTGMMKRTHTYPALLALLLTAAFAGCRQEPLPETGDAIRFSVNAVDITAVETKAVSTTPTDGGNGLISDGSSVKLYGSLAGSTTPVFDGVSLTCTENPANTFTWSYGTPYKYWVKDGAYSFRAVYPATASIQDGSSGDEVVVSYDMASANYDLMVGAASVTAAPPTDNTVTLQFGHACAAVRVLFTDVSGDDNSGESNVITHFELKNLNATEGTYTSPAANPWFLSSTPAASVYSWPASGIGSWAVPTDDYASIESAPAWYFVIPQTLTDSSSLYFEYTVGSGTGAKTFSCTHDLKAGSITQWDARMVYTYKIKIQNTISIEVEYKPWEEGGIYGFEGDKEIVQ